MLYFAKDRQGIYVAANSAFVIMAGFKNEGQILGKTDFDIWPRIMAEYFAREDVQVMSANAPIVNKIELILRRDRHANWFVTTKFPLFDSVGEIVGVEGVYRHTKTNQATLDQILPLPAAIECIMENYRRKIDVPELAAKASLSVNGFERKFKQAYGSAPRPYLQRIRLDAARQLLAVTRLSISQISRETGFYDQSHFSHQFLKYTGLSPKAFRQTHQV